jgi:hypothetical protein
MGMKPALGGVSRRRCRAYASVSTTCDSALVPRCERACRGEIELSAQAKAERPARHQRGIYPR